jgi:hopanoid biosynthesis associated protein HpnK
VKRLVITADDFGAAVEVNEAVERAHREGVLTAASLMVSGAAAEDAIARARRMPTLRVGLHVVLTDGRPLLAAEAVSRLVDHEGAFRANPAVLGALIAANRGARREAGAEIAAQFESFRATGLRLDHCNAHKHFHLHPVIGGLIAEIGIRHGLRSVRVPVEPARVLRRIDGRGHRFPWLPAAFAHRLRRRLRTSGLVVPDQVFGLRWSGQMTAARLSGLIRDLPSGLSEIYLHPATGVFPGAAPGYRYREELDALTAPEVIQACRDPALRLGGFSDFEAPARLPGAAPQYLHGETHS